MGHFSNIEAVLRKLAATVAEYSTRIDSEKSRLDRVEDIERVLAHQLGAVTAGLKDSNISVEEASHEARGAREAGAQAAAKTGEVEVPFQEPGRAKIPAFMNATQKHKYWTEGTDGASADVWQKPIHPHNQEDAILSTEDVLELGPDEVAHVLSRDRELLATVTARLSSGKQLADLIFGVDSSKLPAEHPTDEALTAIMTDPFVAKKALNLTMTTLGRGVTKLAAGKPFADELFGTDTGRLIGEAFQPEPEQEEEEPDEAAFKAPMQTQEWINRAKAVAGRAVLPPGVLPPPVPKEVVKAAAETTPKPKESNSGSGEASKESKGGLKVLGLGVPHIPMPNLPIDLPDVPNPLDLFRWFR